MKFIVSKKGVLAYLPITILYNVAGGIMIVVASLDEQKEAIITMIVFIIVLILLNVILFFQYQMLGSLVIFDRDDARCKFLGRTRRIISYKEVKEYGIFEEKYVKFIYISKVELSEFQREEKVFELYKKTKNVIVFQYNDKALKFLETNVTSPHGVYLEPSIQ